MAVAVGLAVLVLLASGAARARGSEHRAAVACPLGESATTPVCCGPPVATPQPAAQPAVECCGTVSTFCCPANADCVAEPTIRSAPDPSQWGAPVTVTGSAGVGNDGTSVTLWQTLAGASGPHPLATTTSTAGALYTFDLAAGTVTTNRSYYVVVGTSRSLAVTQDVQPKLALTSPVAPVRTGRKVTLQATITPAEGGSTIALQQRAASGWRTRASGRLGPERTFSIAVRFRHSGRAEIRLAFAGNARNSAATSAPLTLTIR